MGSPRICVIDYGMGNLGSVCNALRFLGEEPVVSGEPGTVAAADICILPGVGAFGEAMSNLKKEGLIDVLHEQVMERKKPFLGICLGMQLLAEDSSEMGLNRGLGWIPGHVRHFADEREVRVPHVGWSKTRFGDEPLFSRIEPGARFYFDHSYHVACDDGLVVARCDYNGPVAAAIRRDNIFGVQFHPEKSQRNGLKVLRNFLNVCRK